MTSVSMDNEGNQSIEKGDFAEIIAILSYRCFWNTC